MKIFVDISSEDYERIKELVRKGGYQDINQFVNVAVDNQISMESSEDAPQRVQDSNPQTDTSWELQIDENLPLSQPADIDRNKKLLFSQYYRFFPLIPVMIELANYTAEKGEPVRLQKFEAHLKERIVPLRDRLVEWEEENSIKKQNRKSTGFPKEDVKNPEYSMKRFIKQYVGYYDKNDLTPHGLGNTLGFVSINPIDRDKCLLQLTPAGRDFVSLGNPILENGVEQEVLSLEEKQYLVHHIREKVPEEYRFMSYVWDTLAEGNGGSYTNHLEEFRSFLEDSPGFDDESPSENRVRSHTAGALSRMVELGILSRGAKRGVYNTEKHPDEVGTD